MDPSQSSSNNFHFFLWTLVQIHASFTVVQYRATPDIEEDETLNHIVVGKTRFNFNRDDQFIGTEEIKA